MRSLIVFLLISFTELLGQRITPEKLINQAETLFINKQCSEALIPLNTCIEKFPSYTEAYRLRGDVKVQLNKSLEALTDYNIAVELKPESAEVLLGRAILAYQLKRFDLAKPDFQKLLSFQGTETNMVYFRQSNNEGTDGVLTTQSNIRDQVYNYLGLIAYDTDSLTTATVYFDSAISINPRQADYYAHRGRTKFKLGEKDNAMQDFFLALRLNPDHAVSKNNLAIIYRQAGKIEEAEKLLLEAKLANAKAQRHHSDLAILQLESGRYTEAILNFDTAILIEPKDGELFVNRGLAKEKLNNLNGAMRDYTLALQLDDHWPKAWFVQGNIFLKQNKISEALENYSMAILLDDQYALAYHNRAITFMKVGDKKKACADIVKAEEGMVVSAQTKAKMCGH